MHHSRHERPTPILDFISTFSVFYPGEHPFKIPVFEVFEKVPLAFLYVKMCITAMTI
jgi:hypothetical protein